MLLEPRVKLGMEKWWGEGGEACANGSIVFLSALSSFMFFGRENRLFSTSPTWIKLSIFNMRKY